VTLQEEIEARFPEAYAGDVLLMLEREVAAERVKHEATIRDLRTANAQLCELIRGDL
jgi:hypothetical protein